MVAASLPPPVSKVSQSFHLSSRLTFFDRKLLLPAIVQRDHQAFPLPPSNALTLSRFGSRFILPYSHPLCDHRSMTSATIQRVFQLVPRVLRGFRRYCESSIYCEARNDTLDRHHDTTKLETTLRISKRYYEF